MKTPPKRKRRDDVGDGDAVDEPTSTGALGGAAGDRIPRDASSQRKWTRLLLRELYDLGFREAAACLEREAGVRVRSSAMERLQTLVMQHRWDDALASLQQHHHQATSGGHAGDGGPALPQDDVPQMTSRAAAKEVALLLLKRKYVELLLQNQLQAALETFQQQILPHFELSEEETQELAVLLLCTDKTQMEKLVQLPLQDEHLLGRIEALVSPDEVVPHGRLRQMVLWEDSCAPEAVSFANAESVNVECISLLLKHTHEVIDLAFSPDGKLLASVAQDGKIIIWELVFAEQEHPKTGEVAMGLTTKVVQTLQCIEGAPTCIAWSPDSRALLSGGGEDSSVIQLWNPLTGRRGRRFQHPAESVASLCWMPDGSRFLSGSVGKLLILWNVDDASVAYQWGGRRALEIVVNAKGDQAFVLCSETELRVYNLVDKSDRLLLRADHLMSAITVSPASDFILLSFIEHEEIACFDVSTDTIISRQRGFKQERYVLRPCFAGGDNELIVSGSEDGKVHVWTRHDGKAIGESSSHSSVVNVVAVHPFQRTIIASASDDETIRLWRLSA